MNTIIFTLFTVALASAIPAPGQLGNQVGQTGQTSAGQMPPTLGAPGVKNRMIGGTCGKSLDNMYEECTAREFTGVWKVECSTPCTEGICFIDTGRGVSTKPKALCHYPKKGIS
ncbi:hypothetical protein BDV37DRAFT_286116 [Aspergillus pseudonomiae]|uniref:Uncharacterized protein n=1 Tax=Aspergillus pseudonomiae TaxID=1506151 RepID=A0A5N7D3N7_9EURO|nr:uncharacterized protein BDV37DRAFT_286116 [Aspergillus pseudonomiae]KAE8401016.1 hypothetical protein BDV37DRAFT_286116 [Aspergillus pseudonomiae]